MCRISGFYLIFGGNVDKNILYKIKLIDKELERRKGNKKLQGYNSGEVVHEKQMLFHKCQKRNRWVFGGNRSGKTECGAVESVWLARGIHPFRENRKNAIGWIVSVTRQVQRDVAQSKVLSYIHKDWISEVVMISGKKASYDGGIIDYVSIKNVFGGESRLYFKSQDQGREKFQGASVDFVWFDEEPPEDIYNECRMRVLDTEGDIFGTMTPLKGITWVYNDIYLNANNDDEVWSEHIEWADNPYLSQKEVDYLTKTMSGEELESRRYGKFIGNGGMVYSEFDETVNVIEPFNVPKDWYDNISIDPGLNNPLSCHWYAVDYDGNIYVIAEHYEAGRSVEYHCDKITEICNKLSWHRASNGMICALIDSAANQRTLASEKSVSELFYDKGILVNTKVNKDLFSGISRVKSYIKNAEGKSRLFIFKNCVNLIREIKGYFWSSDGDNPTKKDDHALDELRYYIMNRPDTPKLIKEKSIIQKDKERLFRKIKQKNKSF